MRLILRVVIASLCVGMYTHAANVKDLPKDKKENILKQWFSYAKDNGKVKEVNTLIKKYPDIVNVHQDNTENTALHVAAKHRAHSIVYTLLGNGAQVNVQNKVGRTPTHYAAMKVPEVDKAPQGHRDILKALINKGANVNIQDKEGKTPLHYAAVPGKPDIIEVLLKNGANPAIQDNNGETPFQIAYEHDHAREMLKLMQKFDAPHGKDKIPKDAHTLSYEHVNEEFILQQISKYPHIVDNILIFALIESLAHVLYPPIWKGGKAAVPEIIKNAREYYEKVHNLLEMVIKLRDKPLKNVSTEKPIPKKVEKYTYLQVEAGKAKRPTSRLVAIAGHINREFEKIKNVETFSPIVPNKTLKLFIEHDVPVPEHIIRLISYQFPGEGREKMLQPFTSRLESSFKKAIERGDDKSIYFAFTNLRATKSKDKEGINKARDTWFEAARTGDQDTIIRLLQKYPHIYDIKNENGLDALKIAIQQKNDDLATTLLRLMHTTFFNIGGKSTSPEDSKKVNDLIEFAKKHNPSYAEQIQKYLKKWEFPPLPHWMIEA